MLEPAMVIVGVPVYVGILLVKQFPKSKSRFHYRIFNEKTGLLEFTLLGLISAGVKDVDIYTFVANNEVIHEKFH